MLLKLVPHLDNNNNPKINQCWAMLSTFTPLVLLCLGECCRLVGNLEASFFGSKATNSECHTLPHSNLIVSSSTPVGLTTHTTPSPDIEELITILGSDEPIPKNLDAQNVRLD